MSCVWLLSVIVLVEVVVVGAQDGSTIVDRLLQPNNYKKSELPRDKPIRVRVGIYLNSMSYDSNTNGVRLSMYFRQAWHDRRLEFTSADDKLRKGIRVTDESVDKIWIPDTFFRNEMSASFHDITVKNRLLRINATGDVWYVTKLSGTFHCPMNLQRFPFDLQRCPIMIESFGYTMDDLYLAWLPTPVDVDGTLRTPQFSIVTSTFDDCSESYTAGNYTCLEIYLHLRRNTNYYITQYFLPTMLLVILSWLSFLISPLDSITRVFIGLVTIVATAMIKIKSRDMLSDASNSTTMMDIWMGACMLFAVLALVEFAIVHLMSKQSSGENQEGKSRMEWVPNAIRGKNDTSTLDKVSLVVFPTAFTLFNIFYWIVNSVLRE